LQINGNDDVELYFIDTDSTIYILMFWKSPVRNHNRYQGATQVISYKSFIAEESVKVVRSEAFAIFRQTSIIQTRCAKCKI